MANRNGLVAVALIFCSATALAREPETALPGAIPERSDDQPKALHWRPLPTDVPSEAEPERSAPKSSQAASDGMLSPFTSPAVIPKFQASAQTYAGYDGAVSTARVRSAAEGRLTSFLALRVEFEHGPATGTDDRLSVGARLGILTQRQYGVDLGAGFFYQPKDFRDEGNLVAGLMIARHFGRLGVFASTLLGSDPEGDDQSMDLRLGTMYSASDWLSVGIDARSRFDFSQDQKRLGARRVDWEMQAAPTAIFCLHQFSLMALVGPSLVRESEALGVPPGASRTHGGLLAMAGAGGAF
jgi:hypothetical protein